MRNTCPSPRSAVWEYWTLLIACLFRIHYSDAMPHVIRIGECSRFARARAHTGTRTRGPGVESLSSYIRLISASPCRHRGTGVFFFVGGVKVFNVTLNEVQPACNKRV